MSLLLFERFGVEGVFVQDSAVLSLYAVGRLTGCVADCGQSKIDIAPVYEGLLRPQAIRRLSFGVRDIDAALRAQLDLASETVEQLREQHATVCETQEAFDTWIGGDGEKSYVLPDGKTIDVKERTCAWIGEVLFRPDLLDVTGPGIAEGIYQSTYCQVGRPKGIE